MGWLAAHMASCLVPLAVLSAAPAAYRRRRLLLLVATRLVRVAGVALFITPNQAAIWGAAAAPTPPAGCASALFLSQYFKLAYLVCQSLAHAVPLKHHAWLLALNAGATLHSVPSRCAFDCGASPTLGTCAVGWLRRVQAALEPLWVISLATRGEPAGAGEPWRACAVVQAWIMLILGVALPLLFAATVEEGWKARFLAARGYPRVTPRTVVAVAGDLAVAAVGAVVALQAVLLFFPP